MEAAPCADCGTTGGLCDRGYTRPKRRSGSRFGVSGVLCQKCYRRRYHQAAPRRRKPRLASPKPASKPKELKPFVVDPTEHMGIVWLVALKYRDRGIELDDLVAEGQIGLIKACRGFNPNFGVQFSTYAAAVIKSTLHRMVVSKANLIRIPEYLIRHLRSGATVLETPQKSACLADAREARGRKVVNESRLAAPLSTMVYSRDDATVEMVDSAERVAELLGTLTPPEAQLLRLRFGLDGPAETRKQIGKACGATGEMIRLREIQAIQKLRDQLGVAS